MIFKLLFLGFAASFVIGCASGSSPSLSGIYRKGPTPPSAPPPETFGGIENAEPEGILTLEDALTLSLAANPLLGSYLWEIRAREGSLRKARAIPNPSVELTMEDIVGTGSYQGVDQAQTTLAVEQTIELGGKWSARTATAQAEYDLALWDYEAARWSVQSDVVARFTDVAIAQERVRFAGEGLEIAERLMEVVTQRVASGKVSPTEETKARITLSSYRIDLELARVDMDRARYQLAALWGNPSPRFASVSGSLDSLLLLPPFDSLLSMSQEHPDIHRAESRIALLGTEIERQHTVAVPDITVRGGARHYEATGDYGAVVGLSLPLPLFDRNQGGIQEAEARFSKAEYERKDLANRRAAQLTDRYHAAERARAEVREFRDQVLPDAQSAYEAVREGYALGRFGLIDVLDAERTLLEVRSRYVDALIEFNRTRIELLILAGDSFTR